MQTNNVAQTLQALKPTRKLADFSDSEWAEIVETQKRGVTVRAIYEALSLPISLSYFRTEFQRRKKTHAK